MRMIAYTDDSRPDAMPESTVVAGPVRAASAMSRTGVVSVDVKYSVSRLSAWASTRPMTTAPNTRQPMLWRSAPCLVVADVEERDRGRADDGEDAGGEEAAVDGLQRVGLAFPGPHREHADDRGEHADRARDQREDQAERPLLRVLGVDRVEGGDAEDDRGDEGDLVGLEQVGGHAGAVAHVVAHVVGDRRRVARVVFGDAGFDLADQVGADVGRLGEDAAADSQEQRQQRAAEAEADQDGRCGVLEDGDDDRGAEQAEADGEHAGHAAGAEGDLQGRGHRSSLGRRRGADVALRRQAHADEPGESRHQAAGHERERAEDAGRAERQRLLAAAGLITFVEVKNTTIASGTRITPIVLNWRFR